ncbi:hypothetical protein SADUNF_Sadunf08G0150900 [Salix dunnii]|uniref:Protein SDA1 n=1 Tax=Salix dunnii TaxID=1413687 RepID=A0A835JYX3_9ROSI|nr:hypothetical protein SADUNF_Sadunf08G0150900 [Salix dunnii]
MSTADSLSASGRSSEKLSLPSLQSKMKIDPEGYETELGLVYNQFKSALDLFQQQAALNFASSSGVCADPTISKDLSDRASFLAHVTPFYPKQLAEFPAQLAEFLKSSARTLPSGLRCHVTQALILLINRDMVDISETLALFMELQTLGDRTLRNLAFTHVVHSIRKMNKKHKNEAKNRALQNILFVMLQQDDEARAKRALITLCELHRRKVWFDDRTANSICMACFHSSSRIMIAALSFLLDYEKIEDDDEDDSDASSGEDDPNPRSAQVVISKEYIYKVCDSTSPLLGRTGVDTLKEAHNQGTVSSKKKKKAKLQRAIRSMKRQQRLSSENNNSNYYSPFNHLKDAQGFAERLFSRLQTCNERFEVKMMMLKVIARTVGLHRLILLNFYPFLQKYVQPHQRDITNLLAAAVQACHDMVPPDAVEPLFKQIVNQFVHDRSRPEAIAVGLNVIREICLRIPLLMNEDLLQDLVLYKKSHEKAVSVAARSLITLFREVCPSLLIKKDRGRPIDPKARPKAYGEINIVSSVPGAELLEQLDYNDEDKENSDNVDDLASRGSDEDSENDEMVSASDEGDQSNARAIVKKVNKSPSRKRKFSDFDGQLLAADTSLRALKKMTEEKLKKPPSDSTDGILSNEDFRRIKELTAKKDAKIALTRQGFKVPSSDDLSAKRVDPAKLEAHVRAKLSKEERLAMVRAGREDRESYKSKIAVKQKKTGGESNRQKEHKKQMPLAAKRAKVERSRQEKKRKQNRSGKQFRGKKAWK